MPPPARCRSPSASTARRRPRPSSSAHFGLSGSGGLLLVQPPPADLGLDAEEVEAWTLEALEAADVAGIIGTALTPYVLAHVARASQGRALRANIGLIVNNARTAGTVAAAMVATPTIS